MKASESTLRLAEQAVVAHKRRLPSAANKDQVRRAIAAAETQVARIRAAIAEGRETV